MAITLSVIFLIVVVSLYDYFSARNWQQVTSSSRNDIVFESRNKEYGAYEIRRGYDRKIVFILLGLCLLIGGAFGTYRYIKSIPEVVVAPPPIDMSQFDIPAAPPEKEIPPPIEEPPPPTEKTIAFVAPVITDEEVTEDIKLVEPEVKVSTTTNDVEENFNVQEPEAENVRIVEPVVEEIPAFVDEEATYSGYASFLSQNLKYPETAIEEGLEGRCYLNFIVDKSGNITNITVLKGVPGCPECDKEAKRVISMMPNWTPAKLNGKVTKSNCKAVVKFQLAN
jgi:protein TonB